MELLTNTDKNSPFASNRFLNMNILKLIMNFYAKKKYLNIHLQKHTLPGIIFPQNILKFICKKIIQTQLKKQYNVNYHIVVTKMLLSQCCCYCNF